MCVSKSHIVLIYFRSQRNQLFFLLFFFCLLSLSFVIHWRLRKNVTKKASNVIFSACELYALCLPMLQPFVYLFERIDCIQVWICCNTHYICCCSIFLLPYISCYNAQELICFEKNVKVKSNCAFYSICSTFRLHFRNGREEKTSDFEKKPRRKTQQEIKTKSGSVVSVHRID